MVQPKAFRFGDSEAGTQLEDDASNVSKGKYNTTNLLPCREV